MIATADPGSAVEEGAFLNCNKMKIQLRNQLVDLPDHLSRSMLVSGKFVLFGGEGRQQFCLVLEAINECTQK